jgi:8-oxo-dGTP pyrophosphatase MutT (NUDIX family)
MRQARGVGRRIDHLDNPQAPPANSLVPSVNVVVVDDDGAILLIRRTDNDNWSLPGGAMDLGESIADAATREVHEETGISCTVMGLVGLYTNPRHVIEYTSNGEVRQEFSIVFTARPLGGTPTPSSESAEVRWVTPDEIDRYPMHPSMRQRIMHYLEHRHQPYIG